MTDSGPRGATDLEATPWVRFNQQVAPLGAALVSEEPALRFALSPPVEGRTRWRTGELLVFEPQALAPAQHYEARLVPAANAEPALRELLAAHPVAFAFETPGPRVVDARPSPDATPEDWRPRQPVLLVLDQPVDVSELRKVLGVQATPRPPEPASSSPPAGTHATTGSATTPPAPSSTPRVLAVHVEALGPGAFARLPGGNDLLSSVERRRGRLFAVRPAGRWPLDSVVTLTLARGLHGRLGPVVSPAWQLRWTTPEAPRVEALVAEDGTCNDSTLRVSFTSPIARAAVARIHVHPQPPHFEARLADTWDEGGSHEVELTGAFSPAQPHEVTVEPTLRDIYGYTLGEGTAGKPWKGSASFGGAPSLALSPGGTFAAGASAKPLPATLGLTTRWLRAVRVRVASLSPAQAARALYGRALPGAPESGDEPRRVTFEALGVPPSSIVAHELPLTATAPTFWSDRALDLRELLGNPRATDTGVFLVEAAPLALVPREGISPQAPPAVSAVFRRTDLGPMVFRSQVRTAVQVVRLSTGRPVVGARVSRLVAPRSGQPGAPQELELGRTDETGQWSGEESAEETGDAPPGLGAAPNASESRGPVVYVVRDPVTHDFALVSVARAHEHLTHDPAKAPLLRPGERMLFSLSADRRSFRPGESIALVGFALVDSPYADGGLRALPAGTTAHLRVTSRNDEIIAETTVALDAQGKLWSRLPLPSQVHLGRATATVEVQGATAQTHLALEDFRTPEFEVEAEPARAELVAGEVAAVRLTARHYTGVPVKLVSASYAARCTPSPAALPALPPGWTVGVWDRDRRKSFNSAGGIGGAHGAVGAIDFTAALDAGSARSLRCTVDAEVTDASAQTVGAQTAVRVHPSTFYLAVQAPRAVHAGDEVDVPVRAVDWSGKPRDARDVSLKVVRLVSRELHERQDGRLRTRWEEREELVARCGLAPKADDEGHCRFRAAAAGNYRIDATASDGPRRARTSATFNVWARRKAPPAGAVHEDPTVPTTLALRLAGLADERSWTSEVATGQTLALTIDSPCAEGLAFLSVARAGLREQHALALHEHHAKLALTVRESWFPRATLELVTVCKGRDVPLEIDSTTRGVALSPAARELAVAVNVPAAARPSTTLPIDVDVRGADGEPPRNGHVALWAVDEAVLALGGDPLGQPLSDLRPREASELAMRHELSSFLRPYEIATRDPLLPQPSGTCLRGGSLGGLGYGSGAGGLGGRYSASAGKQAPARARFETTPIFLGDVALDERGHAHVEGRLPDNLTSFQVTALASAPLANNGGPGRFGVGKATVTVSAPFIVRPALPRQLRPGDQAEVAALLQNQSGAAGTAVVSARLVEAASSTSLALVGETTREVTLTAGEQLRVPFTLTALRAGTPRLELRARFRPATGAPLDDAVVLPVPVVSEPSTFEQAAAYGTLDQPDGTDHPVASQVLVRFPAGAARDEGGVTLSFSTSLLGQLQDAFQYLVDYPYGCLEQTSSRVLSLVAAAELGARFGLDATEAARRRALGVARILSMQTPSGGFTYWPGDHEVHRWASGYATSVLLAVQRAQQTDGTAKIDGTPTPATVARALGRALDFLAAELANEATRGALPGGAGASSSAAPASPSERALALDVLAEAGRPLPRAAVDDAFAAREGLPLFARTLLLDALARTGDARATTLLEDILGRIEELPGTAHLRADDDHAYTDAFSSPERTDAMVLEALLRVRPEHPLVPKLVRGLLAERKNGRWRNTQENAHALLAVLAYARRFEAADPHVTARAWVGERPVLEAALDARHPETSVATPMAQLPAPGAPLSVVLERRGKGRLAYRLATRWQEPGDDLPARDQGLTLTRALRTRAATTSATPVVPLGESVAFDLTLRNRAPLAYVAIDVPVPAGLEPVLENLGRGHAASGLPSLGDIASHQERHPERVLVFIDHLPAGEHHHTIQLRATTPGDFALPPARAEAMYVPEIYGRTTGARLRVVNGQR